MTNHMHDVAQPTPDSKRIRELAEEIEDSYQCTIVRDLLLDEADRRIVVAALHAATMRAGSIVGHFYFDGDTWLQIHEDHINDEGVIPLYAAQPPAAPVDPKPDWCQGADAVCHHPACACVVETGPVTVNEYEGSMYELVREQAPLDWKQDQAETSRLKPAAPVETDDITEALNARQEAINESMARPRSSAGNAAEAIRALVLVIDPRADELDDRAANKLFDAARRVWAAGYRLTAAQPQAVLVTRGPDCACCEQQPRKNCDVPSCTMKDAEWAK